MPRKNSFIPRDKPKFFVVSVLSGLGALAAGALLFAAGSFGLSALEAVLRPVFFLCWLVRAFCTVGFLAKQWTGRYHSLQDRSWKEQVW
jgi:hypothetical protein